MVNWVTAAINQTYRDIDREAGGVKNFDPDAAIYAEKHKKELLQEYGPNAIIAVSGRKGAEGAYFVSYEKDTVSGVAKMLGGLKRLSSEKEFLMIGRVKHIVLAASKTRERLRRMNRRDLLEKIATGQDLSISGPLGCITPPPGSY
ncbi:hypothetical protein FJZ17_00570 [Candidatus Pacearchaeota archaeon]|nr:hypothetical protein [Candidatus Pacearchaeota archaeon]